MAARWSHFNNADLSPLLTIHQHEPLSRFLAQVEAQELIPWRRTNGRVSHSRTGAAEMQSDGCEVR